MDRGGAVWTTWFIVIGTATIIPNEFVSSEIANSSTTSNYNATTVRLSSAILSTGIDQTTTSVGKESERRKDDNSATETPSIGTTGTVQTIEGDVQHSGSSPHMANNRSTTLSMPPGDGNSTAVVLSDGGMVEVLSTVTSGVQSSAGRSTVGSSADTTPESKSGYELSKDVVTTAMVEEATSGFQRDWGGNTSSDITVSEHISNTSTPLLSSIVDPVTVGDSTATVSVSVSTPVPRVVKRCFPQGQPPKNPGQGPDGMTPIICNCSVMNDSKVSCDIYLNISDHLCFFMSENFTCRENQSICNGSWTKYLQREILCESWIHNGSFFTDQFSSSSIVTQSAIHGAMTVETTSVSSLSTEDVFSPGYSVVLSNVTEKPEHRVHDNVNVVDYENFIFLSWNQSGTFDNVVIYLNGNKQAFNDCIIWPFNKSTFVNCSFTLNEKLSPGELLNVTVVVDDGITWSTSYVKQPAIPKLLKKPSVANKSVCFTWIQEGFYDRLQTELFLPTNNTYRYSEVYDSVTGNETVNGVCINVTESLCPLTELRLKLRVESHNRASEIYNDSFYSAPSAPVISCSGSTNSSLYLGIMQNLSDYCLDVSNLSQSDFAHSVVAHLKSKPTETYNISISSESSPTNVKVSYAGVTYEIEAWSTANGVTSGRSSVSCTTLPNPPCGVEISQLTPTSTYFKWSLNGHADEFVYRCQRIYSSSDGSTMEIHETQDRNGTCENLIASENYKVSVRSIVKLGQDGIISSKDSTEMEFWTLPERVSSMNLSSLNHSSLKVIWQHREGIHGVTGYNIDLRNSSGVALKKLTNISGLSKECESIRCHVFINLMSNTNYTVSLRAVNPAGGVSDAVEASNMTLAEVSAGDSKTLLTVAITVTVVLLLILVVLLSLLLFFRQQTKFAVPSSKRPSDLLGFPNPSFSLALEPMEVRERMKPDPVPYGDFLRRVEELHKDSDFSFSAEYTLLQELSPKHPQTAAEMEDNRIKNRYSNILPFDHSRVKLIPLDDDDQCSDYINANYMPGFSTKREFIAAQGPMKSTVDEFWRMIWEQHITTIVMVTNLQERGREKCAEYWPMEEDPIFYGDIQVHLNSESQLNYYIIRVLEVKLGEKKRTVKHLHFIAWPDFGCPENTSVLLDFVTGVRSHMSSPASQNTGSGPILVHCSAGVGRTGTFILVDRLLQHLRSRNPIDVFGLVLEMRNYRCNMIQTESQYIFAYECIKTAIERQVESNHVDEADENVDESPYQNVTNRGVGVPPEESLYQNFNQTEKTVVEMESSNI